ncbi:MAG: single-stranded DNA-binding protein [Oscillospiraceae bacterium]|nr:single-stranded DNA-binding protein [Oscillospiraceae bacterium]
MAFQKLQSGEFMVVGYVPKDAELKQVGQNNSSKTTFSVKASEIVKLDGTKDIKWTNCVAWHDMARACAGFKKGDFVMAVGKIEEREWEGKKCKDLVVEFAVKAGGAPVVVPSGSLTPASGSTAINPANELGDLSAFEEILSDGCCPF